MANDIGTGVFPHGPALKMARDREQIIERLIKALTRGRNRGLMNGTLGYQGSYVDHLRIVLGDPHTCLICGKTWESSTVMDLDDWFCAEHCPVCGGWEMVLNA